MLRKRKIALLAMGFALLAGPAMAGDLMAPICAGCHQAPDNTIWGTIVPGTQTDSTLEVTTGSAVHKIRYDKASELNGFVNARELRDEKAVSVEFRKADKGWLYAETLSSKPSYNFHTMENVVTMAEVDRYLEKSPAEGNYMIVDARGYDNFIEGHLPNAVNIPYYRLLEFKDRLPKDKNTRIIAYCRGFT
ncbi:MAG: rhodanese-like domain-containing protein [Desulfurivibrionaceae bacterium]